MSTARLCVGVLLVLTTGTIAARARQPVADSPVALQIPYTIARWQGTDADPLDAETEQSIAADHILNRTYVGDDDHATGLYIAYYAQQRPGVSIHSPLHCLPGTGWEVLSNDTINLGVDGKTGAVRRLVAQKGRERVMVLYWYAIHGRMIASDVLSRLQLLSDRVRLGRNDAALVRLAVPVVDSVAEAERRGTAFARALVPYL